jgi:hypothetical protein
MTDNKIAKGVLDPLAVARAAGLNQIVDQFPDDVLVAAQAVAQDRADLPTLDDLTAEPWPPMRIRSGQ